MADQIPDSAKLKACPHCGKEDAFVERSDYSACHIVCNECGARGPVRCDETDADAAASHASDAGEGFVLPPGWKPWTGGPFTPQDYAGRYMLRNRSFHDWRAGNGAGPSWKWEYGEGDIVAYLATPAPAVDAQEAGRPCDTCQGNGEVVTDWEHYMHGQPGDTGDEGTKECPDCEGTGRVHDAPAVDAGEGECTCQRYPTHCANDCPLHGLEDAPAVDAGPAGEVWFRHVKRGTLYQVLGEAKVQDAADRGIVEGDVAVIYRGEDGQIWAREYSEFHDGRFEPAALSHGEGRK